MLYGIVDIGSNTMRLSLYRCEGEHVTALLNKKVMAGLAACRENGALTRKGMERCCGVLEEFQKVAANLGLDEFRVFATASLRNITNTQEALEEIRCRTGLMPDLLSGTQEALLDFSGAMHGLDGQAAALQDGLLVDIGGGSTELVLYQHQQPVQAASLPMGSLSLYEDFVEGILPTEKERKLIRRTVREGLHNLEGFDQAHCPILIGIGGTVRATAKVERELYLSALLDQDVAESAAQSSSICVRHVKEMLKYFAGDREKGIRQLLETVPDRVHTLLPGMTILHTIAKEFGCESVLVSTFGVREGYLYDCVLNGRADLRGMGSSQ